MPEEGKVGLGKDVHRAPNRPVFYQSLPEKFVSQRLSAPNGKSMPRIYRKLGLQTAKITGNRQAIGGIGEMVAKETDRSDIIYCHAHQSFFHPSVRLTARDQPCLRSSRSSAVMAAVKVRSARQMPLISSREA